MKKPTFTQTFSADGVMSVDAQGKSEAELINLAFQSVKTGAQMVMRNVSTTDRKILERVANIGKGLVLFDLRS